ncbi:hypothetical protein BOTBODRAFT_30149 [Botryobasidium botryosum FD-172 SS1]|uniref:UBC core domain-containing protein n=1 Tax=Botryobasidium botryosum (strain FD-172 SS1) TaxID=930990 RepID=A0A067MP78_BOTB1|nr:hypothetical protein BOTBODRAFT_30149 [Botryobasidium botryosum FD-172 SS1]
MEQEMNQLIEMGATRAQAVAALRKCKDVMDAAEKIFSGEFDDAVDEDDYMQGVSGSSSSRVHKHTPASSDDEGEGGEEEEDDDDEGYYEGDDFEFETKAGDRTSGQADADPYAGIFFSKDRREEVIEVEEEPEFAQLEGFDAKIPLMTQGEWMKGCPEGGEQGFLFQLYSQLSTEACPCADKCGYEVKREKSMFFAMLPDFAMYIDRLRNLVPHTCPRCSKEFCLACGEPMKSPRSGTQAADPLFHCSNLQGVIIGIGLAMVEQVYAEQSAVIGKPATELDKNKKKRKAAVADAAELEDDEEMHPSGAPRGKKAKGGTGYAGARAEDMSGQVEALNAQRARDMKIATLLNRVRVFLPSTERAGGGQTSDYLVHPTTLAHLRRRFNYVSSSLLRNDSLSDMSDRSVLYFELFDWLSTISNHEALASMMGMPNMIPFSHQPLKPQRPTSSSGTKAGPSSRERTVVYEGSAGPRELLESIVIQATAAIKGLEGIRFDQQEMDENLTEEQKRMTRVDDDKGKGKEKLVVSEENEKLMKFCESILSTARAIDRSLRETKGDAFIERLHASLPKISTSMSENRAVTVSVGQTEEETKKAYLDWATRVRFEYCDLTVSSPEVVSIIGKDGTRGVHIPNYKSHYNNEARMLVNSDMPKRSLAIAKELAVLTTNLPVSWDSSVFLRVDEARVDIIKALITGPEGTPYHNGCFLFDIFLGPSYNQSPPSVKYMTTNGGKFRFNPNLYADGKVCLSLLGTWEGPGWIAGKSTLLQVLISIQSMILCDEPYLNEPGWANGAGTASSRAYSANVRRMVVHTAMLGNLKNPPEPFEDIIRTHFRLKGRAIEAQLDKWLDDDDGETMHGQGVQYVHHMGETKPVKKASGSGTQLHKDAAELKALLRKLRGEESAGTTAPTASGSGGESGVDAMDAIVVDED